MQIDITSEELQDTWHKYVHGGKEATESLFRAALEAASLERRRAAEDRQAARRAMAGPLQKIRAPFLEMLQTREGVSEALLEFREMAKRYSNTAVDFPSVPKHVPQLITGSIGGIVVPPYLFSSSKGFFPIGGQPILDSSVNPANGTMDFSMGGNDEDDSSAHVELGLGFFLYPPASGYLVVDTNPAFNGFWSTVSAGPDAETEGWIGLSVIQLDTNNQFQGELVRIQNWLWNDDRTLLSSNSGRPISEGSALHAELKVSANHHYTIAVLCGGNFESAGYGPLDFGFGSLAGARLRVSLPSVRWQIY